MFSNEDLERVLAGRARGDYVEALREFGIDVQERPYVPPTRLQCIRANIRIHLHNAKLAWQVLTTGEHEEEHHDW